MIIEKSRVLQEKLQILDRSDRRKKETKYIIETYGQLQEISKRIYCLVQQYNTVEHILTEEERDEIVIHFKNIYENVSELADDFHTNSEQSRKLKTFGDKTVTDCTKIFIDRWAAHVDRAVSNDGDIYLLVKNLPDVRASRTIIESILRRLDISRHKPPSTENQLAEYQANLETLRSQIASIQGLTPMVKIFLEKIASTTVTMADLTPEVLDWCREPSRANSFVISLTEGTLHHD